MWVLLLLLFFLWWVRLREVVILPANDWVCIFACLLFRWGVLHRVLLLVGWCRVLYPSGFVWVLTAWDSRGLVLWKSRVLESMLPLQRLRVCSLPSVGEQVPCSQGSSPLMPPLSVTQTLPVTHLVGSSPTDSSFLVTSSIAKGTDVMSQSGALALEALWTLCTHCDQETAWVLRPSLSWEGEGRKMWAGQNTVS